jgi:Glycosyl hydrolase family 9/FG-GAP-like repeat
MNTYFQQALDQIENHLSDFANSFDFWSDFELAFGNSYNRNTALNIKNSLSDRSFTLPETVIVSDSVLGSALGVFDISTGKIYIKESLVLSGNLQLTSAVILEEIGHWIDREVNIQDSAGDEGQIFSNLVRGNILTPAELVQLKAENDTTIIQIAGQNITVEQSSTNLDYGDALSKSILFYDAQRSGYINPATNRVPWRGDSALNDGSDVGRDLSGGYYDAGDHVKFGFPLASAMTMLSWGGIQYRQAYEQSGQLDELMATIKQGTEYIKKANVVENGKTTAFWGQVGDGITDHNYWGSPENLTIARPSFKIDAAHPGSDLAAESAAALAAASILFRTSDVSYANELLQHAQQLYAFADDSDPNDSGPKKRGKYSDPGGLYHPGSTAYPNPASFYTSSGYEDELGWGAIWLHKAIKEQTPSSTDTTYLNIAKSYYPSNPPNPAQPYNYLGTWTQTWDDKTYGSMVLLAKESPDVFYRNQVENTWLNEWLTNDQVGNVKYTPGGLAWLDAPGSLRYTANTAFVAGIYNDTVIAVNDPKKAIYSSFVQNQVNYILGENPNNFSYVVGFGNNFAQRPHHRAASGTTSVNTNVDNLYDIVGGLVGGPLSLAPGESTSGLTDGSAIYKDDRADFKRNEVALDYNAGLTGVLARQYGLNPDITISVTPKTVTEDGVANLIYTLTRTGVTANPLTVNYSVGGTATYSTDYVQTGAASFTSTTGTVVFGAGSNTANITINPTADATPEANETVVLTLANGAGYKVGSSTNSFILLSDNFNTENSSLGQYNYNQLANWSVVDGTVDLLGVGFAQDLLPGNGLYLDLDGTSNNAGRLESKSLFSFNAGDQITLSFDLAGSQRGDSNSVTVVLGGLYAETFTRNSSDPFTKITRSFSVGAATKGKLVFDHAGGDNLGLLLDNVELVNQSKSAIGTILDDEGTYQVKTVRNDFGNDKSSDILWRNSISGEVYIYQMNGLAVASEGKVRNVSLDWKIAGTGDFNRDSQSDILWRNSISGATYVYQMDGLTISNEKSIRTVSLDWQIAGTGDFNGDNKSDILWRNNISGEVYIYQMDGASVSTERSVRTVSLDWQIAGTGDFNGDNKSDILWRNTNTGATYIYQMNGFNVTNEQLVRDVTTDWVIEGVDDFNNDGKSDILWRNSNSGNVYAYLMNGFAVANEGIIGQVPISSGWNIAGTGDNNGDGNGDILWRNTSGLTYSWQLNGLSKLAEGGIRQLSNDWQIASPTT